MAGRAEGWNRGFPHALDECLRFTSRMSAISQRWMSDALCSLADVDVSVQRIGKCDPYCIVTVDGTTHNTGTALIALRRPCLDSYTLYQRPKRTHTKLSTKRSSDPVSVVRLEFMDWDLGRKDEFIGSCEVKVLTLCCAYRHQCVLNLSNKVWDVISAKQAKWEHTLTFFDGNMYARLTRP
eukprot:762561-Hanusia_phi.AAC.3